MSFFMDKCYENRKQWGIGENLPKHANVGYDDYGQHGNLKRMLKIPYKVVDGKRFYLLHQNFLSHRKQSYLIKMEKKIKILSLINSVI